MFRSWTGLNNRSCTFAVYFTAISLQALNKENDMISCEEPAKIYNVDSLVSVNTCDMDKRKKIISAKFSLDSGKEVSHYL